MEHDRPNLHFWVRALSLLDFLLPNLITVRRISPAVSAPSIIGELDANHSFVGYHIGPHPFHAMMPLFSFPFLKLLAPSLLLWSWSFLSNCFCIWFNDLVKLDQSHGLGGGCATEGGEESLDPCCFMIFLFLQMCELKVSKRTYSYQLPSLKLIEHRTWKSMVGKRCFPFGQPARFQGLCRFWGV